MYLPLSPLYLQFADWFYWISQLNYIIWICRDPMTVAIQRIQSMTNYLAKKLRIAVLSCGCWLIGIYYFFRTVCIPTWTRIKNSMRCLKLCCSNCRLLLQVDFFKIFCFFVIYLQESKYVLWFTVMLFFLYVSWFALSGVA